MVNMNERAFGLYRRRGYAILWQARQYDPVLEVELHKTALRKTLPPPGERDLSKAEPEPS